MLNYVVIKKSETPTAIISLCSDDIMRVLYKKNSDIGAKEVQQNFDEINALRENKLYSLLYSPEDSTVVVNNEGMKFSERNSYTMVPKICVAIVVTSLAHKLIANFYIKIKNLKTPHKVFTNSDDAEVWCHQQNKKHKATRKVMLL